MFLLCCFSGSKFLWVSRSLKSFGVWSSLSRGIHSTIPLGCDFERIDGRAVEKGWRRRQAEELEAEVRDEHPDWSDEDVLIECERRS